MACTPWSKTLPEPSREGTFSPANTVPALPSTAALPIHLRPHTLASAELIALQHCSGQRSHRLLRTEAEVEHAI